MIIDAISFKVKRGRERDFERHAAEWSRLMRRCRGYIGQVLMRDADEPSEYRAEVRWTSREYRDRFAAREEREAGPLKQAGADLLDRPPTHTLLEIV
ncbi:MAG TPA: antibiotic biosynthesis monooxygenase [Candidatus Polarisedimenticolia bacterium]